MTDHHRYRLQGRHGLVEAALKQELSRPRPDGALLAWIKKRKLRIKDQLVSFDAGRPVLAV